jgi:predicted transcriptional regulator
MKLVMSFKPNETLLLKYLGASPVLRIIDFFLDNPLSDYSKNEIVKNLGMGRVTFFKYWKELEKSGAVKVTRSVGRATMYQLARQNEVVRQLIRLDMALAKGAMDKAVKEHQKPVLVRSA